jgi:hypothetical protein
MLEYVRMIFLLAMVGHNEGKKPPFFSSSHKRTPVAKVLAERCWTGVHEDLWNHVNKSMKNGNGSNTMDEGGTLTQPAPDNLGFHAKRLENCTTKQASKHLGNQQKKYGSQRMNPLEDVTLR